MQGWLKHLRHQAIVDNIASGVVGAATICLFQHCVDELISALVTAATGQSGEKIEKHEKARDGEQKKFTYTSREPKADNAAAMVG